MFNPPREKGSEVKIFKIVFEVDFIAVSFLFL